MSNQGPFYSALAFIVIASLSGCSSVSDLTKERVSRSEVAVQQAQQTIGNSEAGAMELQRARDSLSQAQQALKNSDEKQAERAAQQAQLNADLAVAKSQSASARKAAEELQASIRALRNEAERGSSGADSNTGGIAR